VLPGAMDVIETQNDDVDLELGTPL
jgi:hypothetical protein